jgi:hypothetical protein
VQSLGSVSSVTTPAEAKEVSLPASGPSADCLIVIDKTPFNTLHRFFARQMEALERPVCGATISRTEEDEAQDVAHAAAEATRKAVRNNLDRDSDSNSDSDPESPEETASDAKARLAMYRTLKHAVI